MVVRVTKEHCSQVTLCEGCLRITVGTPAENERVFRALVGMEGGVGSKKRRREEFNRSHELHEGA